MEFNFAGRNTWQDCSTIPEIQLQQAFRSEADFSDFVTGYMMERANDLESQKEAYNRMTLLNYMAGIYDMSSDMPGSAVNLTTAFNIFVRQSLREGGIPFEISIKQPNKETIEAMLEAERIAKDPSVKGYTDLDELFAELKRGEKQN